MKILKLFNREIRDKNIQAAKIELRKVYFRTMRPALPDPIFIVGCSRSGTTVTYETISASKELVSFGYEIPQFWNGLIGPASNGWHSEAAYAEDASESHAVAARAHFFAQLGRKRVVDKTCINVLRIPYLLELFPKAKFVYIHRDGPDNISSLIDGWRDGRFELRQFLGGFPEEVSINDGEFDVWHFFLPPGWRQYNQSSLEEVCAYQWETANTMALAARGLVPKAQWIELCYEDIFVDPVNMYQTVYEGLGLTFDTSIEQRCATLANRPTSIVGGKPQKNKWQVRNREEVTRVLERIEPLRANLGYGIT